MGDRPAHPCVIGLSLIAGGLLFHLDAARPLGRGLAGDDARGVETLPRVTKGSFAIPRAEGLLAGFWLARNIASADTGLGRECWEPRSRAMNCEPFMIGAITRLSASTLIPPDRRAIHMKFDDGPLRKVKCETEMAVKIDPVVIPEVEKS